MNKLNLEDHTTCVSFYIGDVPLIEILEFGNGFVWEGHSTFDEIIFITDGKCRFLSDNSHDNILEKGDIIFLPADTRFCSVVTSKLEVMIFRMENSVDTHPYLNQDIKTHYSASEHRPITIKATRFLHRAVRFMKEGYNHFPICRHYQDLKTSEILYLLTFSYPPERLSEFLMISGVKESSFRSYISRNWRNAKNTSELITRSPYSRSSFEIKFKKCFGVTPHVWLTWKKAKAIEYDLRCTRKSFKQLCGQYRFASVQQFSSFCKKNFAVSPSHIRKYQGIFPLMDR